MEYRVIRILLIDDEAAVAHEIGRELVDLPVEVIAAVDAEDALRSVEQGAFDMVVCDLRIPASTAAPDPHTTHGISVYDRVRVALPSVPVIIFSGYGELADLNDRLSDAPRADLVGEGEGRMVTHRPKGRLPEVIQAIRTYVSELDRLSQDLEMLGQASASLASLDRRLLRIHARQHDGVLVRVENLNGGRSSAKALRVEVERADGQVASRVVAKLNELSEVEDEEHRYDSFIGALAAGTYTHRVGLLRAGAQHRAGIFYALAYGYDMSLFDLLRTDPSGAATAVNHLRDNLRPWFEPAVAATRSLQAIRRLLVRDDQFPKLRQPVDAWVTPALEAIGVPIRSCPSHGDLHGGNLLLAAPGKSLVIDFGRLGSAGAGLDPITLELSAVLHPDAGQPLGGWPSLDQASHWMDLDRYLVDCPFPQFVRNCRIWTQHVARGEREQDAFVYSYALRQLLYPATDLGLAAAFSRGAAERLLVSS
jgi:CheY-like chemotaxis protein